MEQIGEIAQRALSTESGKPPETAELSQQVIDQLWLAMVSIYGHKWTSSFGECDADHIWARGLADMDFEDMKRGYIACIHRPDPWPPTLPEFRDLCRPAQPKREREAMYRDNRALPPPPGNPAVKDEHLATMREMLA